MNNEQNKLAIKNEQLKMKDCCSRAVRVGNTLRFRTTKLLIITCYLLIATSLSALDFSLRPKAFLSIPLGSGNIDPHDNKKYNTGGGADLGFEIDLASIWPNPLGIGYTAGIEGGIMINPSKLESEININFYSLGGALGLYYFPLSRLFIRADTALGVYRASRDSITGETDFFWRLGGEAGFRFTPNFLLAANTGWRQYQGEGKREEVKGNNVFNSGMYAGLTAQLTFQAGRRSNEGISAVLNQDGAVYPAFMQMYQSNSIGNIVIRNNENAEIRDVRVSFRAGNYTASEYSCGTVPLIPRGRSADIPLLADFSNDILRFTDNGRIMGELVIRYRILGQLQEAVRAVTVAAYNRNTVSDDVSALAAFVSPSSPEVLDFARQVAGLERANRRTGHNNNFSYAVHLIETMSNQLTINREQVTGSNEQVIGNREQVTGSEVRNQGGLTKGTDSGQENLLFVNSYLLPDTRVQFPAETLIFKSGTAKDLALLVAASLESVNISSAIIKVTSNDEVKAEGELLVAISLNVGASAAETLFNGTDRILIVDDNVWLPLSMAAVNEGFLAAWAKGAAVLNAVFASGNNAEFVDVHNAWAFYPPAPLPELGKTSLKIDNTVVTRTVNAAMQTYITQEINPIIQRTGSQANSASQQNRLGILYTRAGRTGEAKAAYERAAGLGSVQAMTNRGNLALTEKDYTAAERWYKQALQREPENAAALRGLERIAGNR